MHLDDRQCMGCVSGADEAVGSPQRTTARLAVLGSSVASHDEMSIGACAGLAF